MNLLTKPEAAKRSRLCTRTLERHIDAGTGPIITRIGRRVLIAEDDLMRWLESLRRVPAKAAA